MRYSLGRGVIIKSENAAKPVAQASKTLCNYISGLEDVGSSFDYGCGKLRYTKFILETTDRLSLVDSEIQLGRMQSIFGNVSSVRGIATKSNRMTAVNVKEFSYLREKFDRGFCINVLSVIPFLSARRHAVLLIRQRLHPGGTCLFVVQYPNSDFERMSKLPNARPWRDGFLIDSLRGFSFYGLIPPKHLSVLVASCGFEIIDQTLDDGRVCLLGRSKLKPLIRVEVLSETNFRARQKRS